MAIYGQSWRGGGNMSFRNPMAKAAMNNNPMGNQQTLKPVNSSPQPQYVNPTLQAGQANLQRLNQSMAQTLNRPLQRRADAIAGVQPGPMINPNAARNVLMGQNPDANLSMRPMTIPGMKFDSQQNAMVRSSPYEARGIQPGMLPILKPEADAARATQYRNQWENRTGTENVMSPMEYSVATNGYGQAMYSPGSGGQVSGGNPMSQAGISSVANARIARAARLNGVTSSGIDQWRKTSPIAQTIRGNADTRIANLPQNAAPQVQPVLTQQQNPAIVPTSQVQPSQVAGMGDWDSVVNPPAISVPETPVAPPPTASPNAAPNQLIERALAAQNRSMANSIAPESSVPEGISKLPEQALQVLRRNLGLSPQAIGINAYRGARNMLGGR